MAFEQCSLEVAKALGRELTQTERQELTERVTKMVEKFERSDTADDINSFLQKEIDRLVQDTKTLALIERRNTALNAKAQIQLKEKFKNIWEKDPREFFKALFDNTALDRPGAREGVASAQSALAKKYTDGLFADLSKNDLIDIANDKTPEVKWQIWQAVAELSKETPDRAVLAGIPKDIMQVAEIFSKYSELARQRANRAGAHIGKLEGRVIRRSHDNLRIQKAAGDGIPVNDAAHEKAWVEFVSERIDWERSMPDVPVENRGKILSSLFRQFANGYHLKFAEGGSTGLQGFANIGKKLSKERVIHFKEPRGDFEYNERFGVKGSLLEANMNGLRRLAQDTGLMERLGPNAMMNIEKFVNDTAKRFDKEGRGPDAKAFLDEWARAKEVMWPHVTGEINIPANAMAARLNSISRNLIRMADLGGAVLSGLPDVVNVGAVLRYAGDRTNNDFFGGMREATENILGLVKNKGVSQEQAELAAELSIGLDSMLPIGSLYDEGDFGGRTSSWIAKFFRLNGLSYWTDAIRMAASAGMSLRHAQMAGRTFDQLPEGMRTFFTQFGMGEPEWNLIRQAEKFTDGQGRSFLTPERVEAIPDSVIEGYLKSQGRKVSKGSIQRVRDEIGLKYRAMYSETAAMAASEPGLMERSIMLQASRPGTWQGEAMRHFWMYKSFMVSTMRKHLGREIFGYSAENLSLPQALSKIMRGENKAAAVGIANMFVFSTMMGYASMSLKDIAKGREPRVPKDPQDFGKIFAAAAAQSGSLGIYGDFLFGEAKSRFGHGPLETFMGPTYRRVSDIWTIGQKAKGGDLDAIPDALRFGIQNTPGVGAAYNLFYTKAALDYLITYRVQEALNPGYLRRMEQRLKKEKNQEFLVPPTSVIPYGGM